MVLTMVLCVHVDMAICGNWYQGKTGGIVKDILFEFDVLQSYMRLRNYQKVTSLFVCDGSHSLLLQKVYSAL